MPDPRRAGFPRRHAPEGLLVCCVPSHDSIFRCGSGSHFAAHLSPQPLVHHAVRDRHLTITRRNLLGSVFVSRPHRVHVIQPVMFVLMFRYFFGGGSR